MFLFINYEDLRKSTIPSIVTSHKDRDISRLTDRNPVFQIFS